MQWRNGPILFLDVDGVLNSHRYADQLAADGHPGGMLGIDPEAVRHLQEIVDRTGCFLVLSSTWRKFNSLTQMCDRLRIAGMRDPIPLIARTPDLYLCQPTGCMDTILRGTEVKTWMEANDYHGRYVILDDDDDFLEGQPLVQTSFSLGLTATEVARCVQALIPEPSS